MVDRFKVNILILASSYMQWADIRYTMKVRISRPKHVGAYRYKIGEVEFLTLKLNYSAEVCFPEPLNQNRKWAGHNFCTVKCRIFTIV